MKKLIALMMLICIALLPAAMAEETPALNWADFEPILEQAGVTGQFYNFDQIAVKIWIPDGMQPTELTDEEVEQGYIGYYEPEDKSGAVAVMYVDVNGMSLEEYSQYLTSEAGATEVEVGTVNGLPCVSYKLPEQDSVSVTFTTEAGYMLEVTCCPLSVENAEYVWGAVVASIQPE